jgi:hypothetical protein
LVVKVAPATAPNNIDLNDSLLFTFYLFERQ